MNGVPFTYRSHLLASGPGMHLALALAQVEQALGPLILCWNISMLSYLNCSQLRKELVALSKTRAKIESCWKDEKEELEKTAETNDAQASGECHRYR